MVVGLQSERGEFCTVVSETLLAENSPATDKEMEALKGAREARHYASERELLEQERDKLNERIGVLAQVEASAGQAARQG